MKKIFFLVLAVSVYFASHAQAGPDTSAEYYKTQRLPDFKIMQPDSTWFSNKGLPKNKPVVVIYFSPECGHCQLAAQEIKTNIDKLNKAFFVWVSYYSVPEIKTFTEKYDLKQYKNFRFGRDPNYFIPTFYKVKFTPFMAVYDKKGKLVQAFEQGTDPETLAKLIHDNS